MADKLTHEVKEIKFLDKTYYKCPICRSVYREKKIAEECCMNGK
jgi:hypothetical protein